MKKIQTMLLCTLVMLTLLATAVQGRADEQEETEYIRCAALGSSAYTSFAGFDLPSDTKLLSESSKAPVTEGGKSGSLVDIGGNMYFRTTLPYESSSLTVVYDLTKETKADSDEIAENDDSAKEEEKVEGTVIDGIFAIGVYISSSSASDELYVDVSLTLVGSDGESYLCRTSLRVDRPYIIYADTSNVEKAEFVSARLLITHDETVQKSLSVLTSLPSSNKSADLSFLEENALLSVASHEGKLTLDKDFISLGTDDGDVLLSVLPEETASDDSSRTAFVSVGCAEGEGTVTASVKDSGYTESSHAVFPENGLVPVRTVRNGNGPLDLRFRSSGEKRIVLNSISYHSTDEAASMAGSFTTLTYSDGKLSATGKLSSDIVNEYPDATVGLYTAPVTGTEEPVLLSEVKMTSRFSFSVSLENYPHAQTDNTFFVGIITDEGMTAVTKSRFISAKSGTIPTGSILGLHGANPISVFESGVPYILIDVDLSELIASASASSTTVSRGGFIYGIDSEYIRQLDSDMNFYRSIGVSVYVRFICTGTMRSSADGSWLTYEGASGGELMLRADNRESLNIYPAAAAFLSQRYSNIASFVISSGVNSKHLTGINYRRLWDSVSDIAVISRLVYGASSEFIPDVTVTLPIELTGDSLYAHAETFTALFGEKLLSIGEIPWCLMYTAEGDSPSVLCENIKSSARLNSSSSPLFFTVIYKANGADGDSTAAYESYCDACNASSVQLVFLSVEDLPNVLSRESYSALKNYGNSKDSFIFAGAAETYTKLTDAAVTGSAPLWDFTATYSPEGWSAGYGMTSLQSASVFDDEYSRTLRCITDPASPAGIFLCSLKESIDLSEAPLAEFVFELDAAEGTQLVFIFGNDLRRAEFSLSDADCYEKDGKLRAVCDLSEYSAVGNVGYVGVIIYSPASVTFELSKVNIYSKTLNDFSVAELFGHTSDEDDSAAIAPELAAAGAIALFILLAVSAKITSSLAKHDAKNKELAKATKKRRF